MAMDDKIVRADGDGNVVVMCKSNGSSLDTYIYTYIIYQQGRLYTYLYVRT